MLNPLNSVVFRITLRAAVGRKRALIFVIVPAVLLAVTGLLAGSLVAAVAYNAVFVALSVMTSRAVAVGLIYLLVWEELLGNLVGGVRVLSIGQYSVSVAQSIAHSEALNGRLTLMTAVVMAVVVTAGALVLAARRLSGFSVKGDVA